MSQTTSTQDHQTLLGIALADQALLSAHLAMFAAKTGQAQETLNLLYAIADEISDRYSLPDTARKTMKSRIKETIELARAVLGKQDGSAPKKTTH
ncbi:hypothetical protein E4695_03340 [Alcaligenaceae bacterium 429]|uniref:hypothetical protein n=1 Tax=Paenalcaligenes sp. Me52 TaxID=3392038 RepID=UPI0010921467|nr:hypothetical protein E4695_03340 [Alcaligenaceae bacterium 429]